MKIYLQYSILLIAQALCSCVAFKQPTAMVETNNLVIMNNNNQQVLPNFRAKEIYEENIGNAWGLMKNNCQDFKETDTTSFQGEHCLQLKWNKAAKDCNFIAVGIGWNDYAAVDITGIEDSAAIELYIKTDGAILPAIPVYISLENYEGKQMFIGLKNSYLDGENFGPNWQKMTLPLSQFTIPNEFKNYDKTIIKQMIIGFENEGFIFIDNIRIVPFYGSPSNPFAKIVLNNTAVPPTLKESVVCFEDSINNLWGIEKEKNKHFTLQTKEKYSGNSALECNWNTTNIADSAVFGATFANWEIADLSTLSEKLCISFYIKTSQEDLLQTNINIGLQHHKVKNETDHEWNIAYPEIKNIKIEATEKEGWKKVSIPLWAFANNSLDLSHIQQIIFRFKKSGSAYIDKLTCTLIQ